MTKEKVGNDEARAEVRQRLQKFVLGEIRLARHDHERIAEDAYEIYLMDECPEPELPEWRKLISEELEKQAIAEAAEQKTWPMVTDCDRLDQAEAALRERGILLWQASPCCDSCTYGEFPDRLEVLEKRHPGFSKKHRGYAFFIDQNLPDELADNRQTSVYLGYGWKPPEGQEQSQDEYQKQALVIAEEVCDTLRKHGLQVDWNGSFDRKIGLKLLWQRRTKLE